MRVAENMVVQQLMMLLNLRISVDAAAGVIQINMPAAIQACVVLCAQGIDGGGVGVCGLLLEKGLKRIQVWGESPCYQ